MHPLFWIAPVLSIVCVVRADDRPDDVVVALHERMRVLRKDSIKRRILAELKLQAEPRWTNNWPSQGEIEKILGNQLVGDGSEQPIRRTTRSPAIKSGAEMSYKFSFPVKYSPTDDRYRTYFNLCNMTNYEIKNATLYFFVKQLTGEQSVRETGAYKVHVYKYYHNGEIDADPVVSENRNRPASSQGDWDSVNLTELVRTWADAPNKNHGIMVKAEQKGPTAKLYDLIDRSDGNQTTHTIFLEIEVAEKESVEYRRISRTEPNDCSLEPTEYNTTCCRYSLEVDFEEFGWDWIIAPKRYNAYYCAGMCRRGSTNTQHATLIQHTQAHNMCCSPELMNEMKIIYLDDAGNVQTKVIKNMIVQRCGCS